MTRTTKLLLTAAVVLAATFALGGLACWVRAVPEAVLAATIAGGLVGFAAVKSAAAVWVKA